MAGRQGVAWDFPGYKDNNAWFSCYLAADFLASEPGSCHVRYLAEAARARDRAIATPHRSVTILPLSSYA
ncbi:MAG: hypothetical protein AB1609_22485 [Bacillota bacterium]